MRLRPAFTRWFAPRRVAPSTAAAEVQAISDPSGAIFFGYHDRTPFAANARFLLAHRVYGSDVEPMVEGTPAEIGWFDLAAVSPTFTPVATTTAWSWQQGSLLQWDPRDPSAALMFHRLTEHGAETVICDATNGTVRETWPLAHYAIDAPGDRVLSLNFSRLARLRPGYGHRLTQDSTGALVAPEHDGVWLFDRRTRKVRLLASLAAMATDVAAPPDAHHYVNHLAWSPSGARCVWFHIIQPSKGRRAIRGIVADPVSGLMRPFETERLISHQCWLDDDRLLVTTRDAKLVWRYTVYNFATDHRTDLPVSVPYDGHPMRSPSSPVEVITDTTPDPIRRQHLLRLNVVTGAVMEIEAWATPTTHVGEVRCDLHPRWDVEGRRVCVDTAVSGRREMRVLTL
jgi:hypothetical protein